VTEDGDLGQVEQNTAAWLRCLRKAVACGKIIVETADVDLSEDFGGLVICLLARSVSIARAVVHLVDLGHVVEARMLTRSMFENEIYLEQLASEDGKAFVDEIKKDSALHHRGLGTAIAATGVEGSPRVEEIVARSRQQNPKLKGLTPGNVASRGGMEAAYAIYKQLSSDAGHPSITALKRHFVASAGNGGFFVEPQLKDGEAMNTAYLAAVALLWSCVAANDARGVTTEGELEKLVAEYRELLA
jgi:hypothetical protein